MMNFGPTFIWTAVNLLILYFVLRKLLFKPVTQFMSNRTKSIKDAIEDAEKNRLEAAELKQKYESQLGNAKSEADRILEEARARADKEYEDIINTARKDAEYILLKAQEEIEQERAQMLRNVKNQVTELALLAASKVIEVNMNNEINKALVNKFIDEVGAA